MNDLSNYFSQQDRIAELEAEIELLTKKVNSCKAGKSIYKKKYEQLQNIVRDPTRSDLLRKALRQIKSGELNMSHAELAKEFGIAEKSISKLATQINTEIRGEDYTSIKQRALALIAEAKTIENINVTATCRHIATEVGSYVGYIRKLWYEEF